MKNQGFPAFEKELKIEFKLGAELRVVFKYGMLARIQRFLQSLQAGEKHDLSYLLGHNDPSAPFSERIDWFRNLLEWLRSAPSTSVQAEGAVPTTSVRFRFLLQVLERNPEWKSRSARTLRSIIQETDAVRLFSEVGLPNHPTFMNEFLSRLVRIFIPHFDDPKKLSNLLSALFYDSQDADSFQNLPADFYEDLCGWLMTGLDQERDIFPKMGEQMLLAGQILMNRCVTISLREDVTDRAPEIPLSDHPLLKAQIAFQNVHANWRTSSLGSTDFETLTALLYEAQNLILSVRRHLEGAGVSVDLIYQLDRMKSDLLRLHRILNVLEAAYFQKPERARFLGHLWSDLLRGLEHDRDAGWILRKNLGLLSRKVVERTGYSGEHYVVQNKHEWWHMLAMAAGGGFLTAFTAFLKYVVDTGRWSLFWEFCYSSLNYSLSFLLMHFLGFKLATKQPSMTAAHLAAKLKTEGSKSPDEEFVDEVARISRSQFAAVAGNILAVIPTAIAVDFIYRSVTGTPFLPFDKGTYVLSSVHPLLSATLFYGTVTGFLLWLSSMIAGWFENASAFYRIPALLKSHPLMVWWLGPERAQQVSEKYMQNISGIMGSITLGVLLALTPLLGKFFGVGLQAAHVTLTTAGVTYAFQSVGFDWVVFAWAAIGVACIGLLNFGVSFFIALMIAVRAREVSVHRVKSIFGRVVLRFLKRPWEFWLPR